jgi:HK97 family phage portal protein
VVNEPYAGAWQRNEEINADTVMANPAVYACCSMIAQDIAKCRLRLVSLDADGIWNETDSPSFSPVLRKPNAYQHTVSFVEQWVMSKLTNGNTYALKARDNRGVVTALYILDPTRVTPLVATDGSVYYQLRRDDLSRQPLDTVTVPASEIIHDTMVAIYHPLIGVSPIYAAGAAATQGLTISGNSNKFFSNGSQPGGILTAPQGITKAQAVALKTDWETEFSGDNAGKVAVLAGDLKYTSMAMSAVDAQLIDQLKWTDERICACFHVPPYMVDIGPPPPYANVEPLIQKYYNQCLQSIIVKVETALDEGLGIAQRIDGKQYGTEFDISDLIWMDAAAKTKAAADGIGSGAMSPNEGRKRYLGLGPVAGGDSPYLQQQYFSLAALAQRDAEQPFAKPVTPAPSQNDSGDALDAAAAFAGLLNQKFTEAGLHAA